MLHRPVEPTTSLRSVPSFILIGRFGRTTDRRIAECERLIWLDGTHQLMQPISQVQILL